MRLHPRLLVGVTAGLACSLLVATRVKLQTASLIGWNLGAILYLTAIWRLYITEPEANVRARAARDDEPTAVIGLLAAAAMIASLIAVYAALEHSGSQSLAGRRVSVALAALTLISSWFVVQSLFVGHYAHRHFQAVRARGDSAGFNFPGDPPSGYLDFAYLAICVGATAQVSDPGVQSRPLRNLVTAHAIAAFFYNTAILALGVNILSGLIGH